MRKILFFLFALLFTLFAELTFGAQVSQPILVNSGANSVFKVKVTGLDSGESAILNIGIKFLDYSYKPSLVARKIIKSSDLDSNGFYTYTDLKQYPSSIFKPIVSIKSEEEKESNTLALVDKYDRDCFGGACFRITDMNYKYLKYIVNLEEGNNIVNIGIDCYASGSNILEGSSFTIDDTEARSEIITFSKKHDDKIYTCKPFIVTSGFLGIKSTEYGNEIKYPYFPIAKITSLKYSPTIIVGADIDSGGQDYYPSFTIKEKASKQAYCFISKKQNMLSESVVATFDPRLDINGYACRLGFPILTSPRKLRMKNGLEYSVGITVKGVENKFYSDPNFVDFTYTQNNNAYTEYKINQISAEKDTKNLKIYLTGIVPAGQNYDSAWFYTRIDGSNDKYKLIGDIKESILNNKEKKFSLITQYPNVLVYNEKFQENRLMPYQDGKKYVFGFCNMEQGNVVCKETPAYLIVNASKYAQFCSDNMGKDGPISIQKAKNVITMASADTGVSPYLLMAIIMHETRLGAGTGACYFQGGEGKTYCVSRSNEDTQIFKRICNNLGWDWRNIGVACQGVGLHGCAMGFTQIMQKEWQAVENKVKQKTKRAIANPWNHCDAILATAFKLWNDGTSQGSHSFNMQKAINGYNNEDGYYGKVMAKVNCLQKYWNNITAMESNCLYAGE